MNMKNRRDIPYNKIASALAKICFVIIFVSFLIINFPVLDWFLHSEKMWYKQYDLNSDTSYLYALYERMGILDEVMGYIGTITFDSKWMHGCYHLYNIKSCYDDNYSYMCCTIFVIPMLYCAMFNILMSVRDNLRKTLLFYIPALIIVFAVCFYGIFIYAPRYISLIDDIVSCI